MTFGIRVFGKYRQDFLLLLFFSFFLLSFYRGNVLHTKQLLATSKGVLL